MKYIFALLAIISIMPACQKEKATDPEPPVPPDTNTVYVPIFQPGDTTQGAAYANKLTAVWKAESICTVQTFFDPNYMAVTFLTYANSGAQRESFGFSFIPRFAAGKVYGLKKMVGSALSQGFVSPTYATWTSDGDVIEDWYELDTTANDNSLYIKAINPLTNRVEGTFTASFNIVEPRRNPANPLKVKFSEGRFWAVVQE